jgi:hypothetical protein
VARQQVELSLTKTGNNLNAYGLIASERTALRNVVTSGTLPSNLASYYLGTELRSKIRYHCRGLAAAGSAIRPSHAGSRAAAQADSHRLKRGGRIMSRDRNDMPRARK